MTALLKKSWVMAGKIYLLTLLLFSLNTFSETGAEAAAVTDGAQRYSLENGLKVILKEDHSARVVSIQVWVKTGSANESEEEAGITHVIEHMIFKGTHTRKTGEIARTVESSGGSINAFTTSDRTVYRVEIASDHFIIALDVLLDAVQHSIFDPLELNKEKEVILEEYRRSLDIPERQLSWAMLDLSFKKHPYRRPVIGYESTIRSIDREDIMEYMDKWYTPGNMVLVVVGDFNRDEALEAIKARLRNFPVRSGGRVLRPIEPPQVTPRSSVIKADVQQVYMDLSWHIPPITHEHIPALDLLEVILGRGRSSRLYTRLKTKRNLVREIDANSYSMVDSGLFSIECTLRPKDIEDALGAIMDEVEKMSVDPVFEPELKKSKRKVEADYLAVMESMEGQAQTLAFFETMTGDMKKADTYLERLEMVTSKDIMNVAGLYLHPENVSIGMIIPENSGNSPDELRVNNLLTQYSGHYNAIIKVSEKEKNNGTTRYTLSNGMRVLIKENHRLPLVSVRAALLGGSRLEEINHSGISAFTARMLTRGTEGLSASEIAATVESWGGKLKDFSGRNSFGITGKFLTGDIEKGLALLADLLIHPSFPEPEIRKVKQDILTDIISKKDNPRQELLDLFNRTLYQSHPYGRPVTGTEESIQSIKRSDLLTWHESLVTSSNLVLAIVGDVNKDKIIARVSDLFKPIKSSDFRPPEISSESPLQKERKVHLERPGSQVHIIIGYLGADLKSPDNAVMTLIDTALSGQGGRLFSELRDKQSLAYSVSSFRRPGLETGMFGVYLACEPAKLQRAKEALFKELDRIKKEGLMEQELEDAKRYVLGNMEIDNQTNGSQALRMALDELYGLRYDHHQRFIREIESVTLKDIRQAAEKIILPHGYAMATVGPGH